MPAGIAPPQVRRETPAMAERSRQCDNPRHPLHQHAPPVARLKSRRNFMQSTQSLKSRPRRQSSDLDWGTWKTLNRLRCQMGRCKNNLLKWGYAEEETCECGESQIMEHLLVCQSLQAPCTLRDLWTCNGNAMMCAIHWSDI
ncbi:hypothetical protein JTB14_006821 [Gonioctena quinquepunctata]|nr:hypothetical protein JTB14_006821 [Gonioctena quinquepunctata]